MNKIMTKYEHHQMMKWLVDKFSKDEAVGLLNKKITEIQFENGVLKSELATLEHELNEIKELRKSIKKDIVHHENKELKRQICELLYHMEACGCPIPSLYKNFNN
jgi:uncharacterized membrane protein YcjF (UPF0283 family)